MKEFSSEKQIKKSENTRFKELINEYESKINELQEKIKILEEENIKYNTIMWGIDAGTFIWDVKNDIVKVNDRYYDMLGYTRQEFNVKKSNDFNTLIHPDDLPNLEKEIIKNFENKKGSIDCEFRMAHKSGSWIWILCKGRVIKRDEKGNAEIISGIHLDITSVKTLQEKYNASLALWNSAFDYHSSIMLLIEPISGKIVDANISASKFYGYSLQRLKSMYIQEINMLSEEEVEKERLRALHYKRNYFIFPHKLASGEIKTVEVYSSIVYIESQKLLFSIIHDITERITLVNLIKRMNQNYELFLNSIDEYLFVFSENSEVLFVNNFVKDKLKFDLEQLNKNENKILLLNENLLITFNELKNNNFSNLPKFIIDSNNIKIPVEIRIIEGFWDDKKVYYLIAKDITQILLSEEKFSKLFKLLSIPVAITELSTGNIKEVNYAFCKLFEFEEFEVIGKSAIDLGILSPNTREMLVDKMNEMGYIKDLEVKAYTKTKNEITILVSIGLINVYGQRYRISSVIDITEIRNKEKQLLKMNKELLEYQEIIKQGLKEKEEIISKLNETKENLEKINAEKDKLFSIISHDLRSPFHGFLGLTEILANNELLLDEKDKKELFNQLNIQAKNLFNLLVNLLEWSRVKRGLFEFEPTKINIYKVISSCISVIKDNAKNKKIDLINNVSKDLFAYADEKMISLIFRNLITNAIKFSQNNGQVIINVEDYDGQFLLISVRDFGIGIPSEMKDKLFKIGSKINRKGTAGEESTGLGLLLCKEFIEKHNGKIWVESEEGKGSIFYFTIPKSLSI